VRPTHRSKLLVPGADLDDLALLQCEWTLGLDRFAALRDARLAAGVPPDAQPADLLGEHGDRWLFRFSLPTEHGARTSAVRLTAVGEDVLVEHLVVDERQRSEPSADSPETTRALVELSDVRPLMLRGAGPLVLGERDVPALVEDVLDAARGPDRPGLRGQLDPRAASEPAGARATSGRHGPRRLAVDRRGVAALQGRTARARILGEVRLLPWRSRRRAPESPASRLGHSSPAT